MREENAEKTRTLKGRPFKGSVRSRLTQAEKTKIADLEKAAAQMAAVFAALDALLTTEPSRDAVVISRLRLLSRDAKELAGKYERKADAIKKGLDKPALHR